MSQHPYHQYYNGGCQSNMQQSYFPSWHNRRHSPAADMILEGGRRKKGSFDTLQQIVNERQRQDNDQQRRLSAGDAAEGQLEPETQHQIISNNSNDKEGRFPSVDEATSRKISRMVKDTTSGPAVVVHGPPAKSTETSEGESDNYDSTRRPAHHAANRTEVAGANNFLKISN